MPRSWEYYTGPHLAAALKNAGSMARAIPEFLGPQADLIDAQRNYESAIGNAREGDFLGAARDAGFGALSNLGFSEISKPMMAAALMGMRPANNNAMGFDEIQDRIEGLVKKKKQEAGPSLVQPKKTPEQILDETRRLLGIDETL